MRKLLWASQFLLAATLSTAFSAEPLLGSVKGLKDVTISLGTDAAEPSVRLRCREIQRERARLGFLRVGLVQHPVIRGLEIQIRSHQVTWAADFWGFAQKENWLLNATIRDLEILGSCGKLMVGAKEAIFDPSSASLELRDVTFQRGNRTIQGTTARLFLSGPEVGRLRLRDNESGVIDLEISGAPNEKIPQKSN